MAEDDLSELRKRAKKEIETRREMCELMFPEEPLPPLGVSEPQSCRILNAALFSAKSSLSKGSPRRVFIQDLAAALDRRGLLSKDKFDEFTKKGYEYMEA